jgi:adenosylhomocysteine nucleosidase
VSHHNFHIFFALKQEIDARFFDEKCPLTVMGMGKVNATIAVMNYLNQVQNKTNLLIVNLGTAGSRKIKVGTLVEITEFYERDTSFRSIPIKIKPCTELPVGKCGTGDSIDMLSEDYSCNLSMIKQSEPPWDCLDMEAYALAKTCTLKNIPFVSIKYITDISDSQVKVQWKENLEKARVNLFHFWKDYIKNKSF